MDPKSLGLKYIQTNDFFTLILFSLRNMYWNSIPKRTFIGHFEQKLSNVNNDNELQMLTMRKHDSHIEKKSTSSGIHTD